MCRALTLALTLTLHLTAKPTPTTQQAGHDKCPMCRAPRPRRSTLPVQVRGRGWVAGELGGLVQYLRILLQSIR